MKIITLIHYNRTAANIYVNAVTSLNKRKILLIIMLYYCLD